jgi:uncharacterized damage-inducible protein DinB
MTRSKRVSARGAAPGLSLHLRAMAYNNAWANHRLLGACQSLTDEEFAAPRTGFFPSLRATLNHVLTVDWFYLDAIERALAGRAPNADAAAFFEPAEPFGDCASLAAAQRAADRRLIAVCESVRGAGLSRISRIIQVPRADHLQRERLDRLLAHLFLHQVHHRGQAHAMLSGTRIRPPQLDEFFSAEEAPLRERDFAELGFDEDRIWNPAVRTLRRARRARRS